jgi:hypothetical protein
MQNKNLTATFKGREKQTGASSVKKLGQLAGGLLAFWGLLICLAFYMGASSSVIASAATVKNGGHDHGHGHDDEGAGFDHADDIVIPAGITGAWFNPDRVGEGFFIEVANVDGNRVFVATWYTYRDGLPIWYLGSAPLGEDDRWVEVPMERFSGGRPGVDPGVFDPDTVERADWGTLEFSFSSCHEGSVHYDETEFGFSETIALIRLTLIDELGCEEPEEPDELDEQPE